MKSVFLQSFRIEPRQRRLLSAGLALGLVSIVAAAPLAMLDGYVQRRDEIEALRVEVEGLKERTVALGTRQPFVLPSGGETDILAPDADAATAHLQATLRGLATTLGTPEIRVDSVRVLPTLPEGIATAVRVSASLTVPSPRVFEVVNALETSTPPIVIDSLRVASRPATGGPRIKDVSGPEIPRSELTLALRVYAPPVLATPGPSKPGGRRASREERLP